jgi:hypothetical protein
MLEIVIQGIAFPASRVLAIKKVNNIQVNMIQCFKIKIREMALIMS